MNVDVAGGSGMYRGDIADEEEDIYVSGAMKRKQSPLKRDSLASRYRWEPFQFSNASSRF
jgi:hypothetical protein